MDRGSIEIHKILFNFKKEGNDDICYNVGKLENILLSETNKSQKRQILYDSRIIPRMIKFIEKE